MTDDEVTVEDVSTDRTKNLCNIFNIDRNQDDDSIDPLELKDNENYTESDFIDFIVANNYSTANNLLILSLNIANLSSKLSSLKSLILSLSLKGCKPDVVILVETHITRQYNNGYNEEDLANIVPGYTFFHKGRKDRRGGGVGVLVNRDIDAKAQICETTETGIDFVDEKFENVVVKIPDCIDTGSINHKKDLIIVAVYRQPNSANLDFFLDSIDRLLQSIDKIGNELVIAGDMNINLLNFESHPPTSRYLDIMTNHRMLPRIVKPTRIKHQSATLIDHIFTRENQITLVSGILDIELSGNSGFTDHKPTFTFLKLKTPKKEPTSQITFSYFTKEGHQKRRVGILSHDWGEVLAITDPDAIYNHLVSVYGHHYHSNLTTKTVKRNSNRYRREPWMTDDILADIRRRDRLAKNKRRRAEYKKLRNDIVKKIRHAEKAHIGQKIQDSMGDIKKHWKILKETINKANNKEDVTTDFMYQGNLISDATQNATNFNDFFANIGKETNESVGQADNLPNYYLNKFRKRNEHAIMLSDVTTEEVMDVCRNMNPKNSMDPTGFKQSVVLHDATIISHVLAHLVNCSLQAGICPSNSKLAKVIPVYKLKGDKHLYDNYRPISLLSSFSKIMERLIYNKIFDFLVRQEIIFKGQFGFQKGRNTTHATLDFVKAIEDAIAGGDLAIGVFCDLSKAFDTINHNILLDKLDHYGIRGNFKEWIRSYLTGREQYVEFKGCKSGRSPIPTGVPQGSILGPLLFLLYINDLPAAANLKTVMFADDSNLLIRGNNMRDLCGVLNHELEHINDFFKANKLKLNTKKTKLVCFRKKSQKIDYIANTILLDGDKVNFDEEAVFLGITIDSHLTWDRHCNKVANIISRNNGMLNRAKNRVPAPSLKILYSSFILPHLQYGLAAWGGCSGQNKKRIVMIQKRAIRTINKSYMTAHTEPRMKKMGLLKLEELYFQQCATFIHDITNKRAPPAMNYLITLNTEITSRNLRIHSTDPLHVRVPPNRCRFSANSFCYKGSQLWNTIPQEIRSINEKHIFKNRLKKHLLSQYSESTACNNQRCTDRRHHH